MIHAGKERPIRPRNVGITMKNYSQPIQPNTHLQRISTKEKELLGLQRKSITMEEARAQEAKRFYTWDQGHTIL